MKIIALMNQKGGAGKTTIAVHLAVAVASKGKTVALVDTDPQGSATAWANVRNSDLLIPTLGLNVLKLPKALAGAEQDGIDYVFIDTAPNAGADAVDVSRLADLIVIPVRPSVLDVNAVQRTIDVVQRAGKEAVIVLSACPFRAPEIEQVREALSGCGIRIATSIITDRRSFSRAFQTGRAVHEFEPDGKAAQEIFELITEIL